MLLHSWKSLLPLSSLLILVLFILLLDIIFCPKVGIRPNWSNSLVSSYIAYKRTSNTIFPRNITITFVGRVRAIILYQVMFMQTFKHFNVPLDNQTSLRSIPFDELTFTRLGDESTRTVKVVLEISLGWAWPWCTYFRSTWLISHSTSHLESRRLDGRDHCLDFRIYLFSSLLYSNKVPWP